MLNTRVLTFTVMSVHKNEKYCIFQFGKQSDIIEEVRKRYFVRSVCAMRYLYDSLDCSFDHSELFLNLKLTVS